MIWAAGDPGPQRCRYGVDAEKWIMKGGLLRIEGESVDEDDQNTDDHRGLVGVLDRGEIAALTAAMRLLGPKVLPPSASSSLMIGRQEPLF